MQQAARSIFITGAASGIGRESARHFAAEGWRIGLFDLDIEKLARLAQDFGDLASVYQGDVCAPGALGAAIAAFAGESDGLDVLFNCAGILEMRMFEQTDLDRLALVLDVNVKGVINGIRAALPFLRRKPESRIVTMSSLAAVYGVPEEAVYSASKFAVRGLTEALNIELEPEGIWACDVMVGYVATPMVLEAASRARSVDIVGVNVGPEQVAGVVWKAATQELRVHWFVTEDDAEAARKFDEAPWEVRAHMMKSASGF